jgi:uncharacterized membrane protein (DUF485 family)
MRILVAALLVRWFQLKLRTTGTITTSITIAFLLVVIRWMLAISWRIRRDVRFHSFVAVA